MERDGSSPRTLLGAMIRRQRTLADLSMRQLATAVGISNPYLSQIEHGLRMPSDQVLTAIATSLQTTAEALHEAAGSRPQPADRAAPAKRAERIDPAKLDELPEPTDNAELDAAGLASAELASAELAAAGLADAIAAAHELTAEQRRALTEIYRSFVDANAARRGTLP